MDIVLVGGVEFMTDFISVQIGPLIIKSILSSKYDCELIDFDYLTFTNQIEKKNDYEENINLYVNQILSRKPKIVGFYTMCNSFDITLRMAKKIKDKNSDVIIMFGGPQATLNFEECLNFFDFLDVIVLGESEKSILPVVDKLINNESLEGTKGVAFRSDGQVKFYGMNALLSNEELYDYLVTDYSPYTIDNQHALSLEGGRGCPYNCSFCSTSIFWGRKYRVIDAIKLVDHIEYLISKYNVKSFSIVHDHFTVNSDHVKLFCNEIKRRNLQIEWDCSARVNNLDSSVLKLMKESGCKSIYIGIETGSDRMQQIIHKNIDLDKALNKIQEIRDLGIGMTISLIYGFPDENLADFSKTVSYIEKLYECGIFNVQLHYFNIYNKTEEFDKVKDIMYFRKDAIDFSLYEDKVFDERTLDLIVNYPSLFSQYYTFDTEVRNKYPLFETLICMMSLSINIYPHTILNLVKKVGIFKLYDELEGELIQIHTNKEEENNIGESSVGKNYELMEYMDKYLSCGLIREMSDVDKAIYEFEKIKYEFVKGNEQKKFLIFAYDIQELINGQQLVPNETIYSFIKMPNNKEIKIKKLPHSLIDIVKRLESAN